MTLQAENARQHAEGSTHILSVRRRRWPLVLLVLIVIGIAGAGGAYAWANLGWLSKLGWLSDSFARGKSGDAVDIGDTATIPDLLATQQKAGEDLEALNRTVAEQQEQLKAVVDQLAALSSKVEALQRPAAPASTQPPITTPPPVAQATPKPRRLPSARKPKSSGSISVGGAPLNAAPDPETR